MSLSRNKIKRGVLACLSVTLCATFAAGTALANFDGSMSVNKSSVDNVKFTDVTGQFDTTALTTENFNSKVMEAPKVPDETKTLIVSLDGKSVLDAKSNNETVAQFMDSSVGFATMRAIDEEQKNFINKLNSRKINYKVKHTYSTILNAVAIEVNTAYLSEIKELAGVKSVVVGSTYLVPQTVQSETDANGATVNDSFVYKTGIYDSSEYASLAEYPWGTGAGTVVAILDTGLDYTHDAFQRIPVTTSSEFSKTKIEEKLANTRALERMNAKGASLTADDVYISEKIPFAFDYADNDADVYPSYSNHGTHVAGIVGGYDEGGYDDKDGNHINEPFKGVAPDAQLVICKTFTDNLDDPALGGAEAEDIMAALEDCVTLGVDVINMSLGSTAGFSTTDDDDDEGRLFDVIFKNIQKEGISLICAASNDYSAGFGSTYGTNLASNPDSGTVGSPSTYHAALSVASVSGQKSEYMRDEKGNAVFFENSNNGNSEPYDFVDLMLDEGEDSHEFEYVYVGNGQPSSYNNTVRELIKGRIALIQRGGNTFQQKVQYACDEGAIGVIIFNNVAGTVRMSLGDIAESDIKKCPAVSIGMDAGNRLRDYAKSGEKGLVGKINVVRDLSAGPFMSAFSSWGTTPDLKIKPEITAHGGEITSTVPGGYDEQSGTSMASPNMAGLTALVRNYVKTLDIAKGQEASYITRLTNQLIMSTATTAFDEDGLAYSPRKQGAGLANLNNIVGTNKDPAKTLNATQAFIFTDEASDRLSKIGGKSIGDTVYYAGKDGRPKIELGEDEDGTGVYTFGFNVKNFGNKTLTFNTDSIVMTEQISSDNIAVAEKAYMLCNGENDIPPVFTVEGSPVTSVSIPAGEVKTVTVTITLSKSEKDYINSKFKNGMFVEGFIKLISQDSTQCDLSIPFLTFFGDWEKAPMLDYDVFELAELSQNTSLDEENKPKETIWPTQPFASYYGDRYIIPMGSYVYAQDPDPSQVPMYANKEYCAISRFDEIYNEEGIGNYVTTYNIRCVYAGLLRSARVVKYKLYDSVTGELIKEGHNNRVSKAYSNGGSARPAYVELKLSADELGLLENGKYRFDFEFLFNSDSEATEENTFSFDFYVDYETPVLQDARLRYYNYKEGSKDKQRIYLDLDVFDNHYPQSVMLCYLDESDNQRKLNLATDYITPIKNPVKNGVSSVSIDVTDIWDEYKDRLYVQLDDYALNHSNYYLGGLNNSTQVDTALNVNVLPDTFSLAEGESHLTLDINSAHRINLVYEGKADPSNFILTVGGGNLTNDGYIAVKNGEIVGLKSTNGRERPVTVSNGKGKSETIFVKVTDNVAKISNPDFAFNVIRNNTDALVKGKNGANVSVYPGEDIQLNVVPDPWYYPMENVAVTWSVKGNAVTVDDKGFVHTVSKGSATVSATIKILDGPTITRNLSFNVLDEFTIENMSLTEYHGEGETINGEEGVVVFPENTTIMSIGEEAFLNNTKITKIIIPKTITEIDVRAFKGCTSLKGVYFVNDLDSDYEAEGFVVESKLRLINRNAFEGCTSLEVLDLRNTKVISLGREAFKDCNKLSTIVKSNAIGTAYDRAFMGCSSLTSLDLTGLHVAGSNVFSGCENLTNVTTGRFTAIGENMFSSCRYAYQTYDYEKSEWSDWLYTDYPACNKIKNIEIKSTNVGNGAFENCTGLQTVNFTDSSADGKLEFFVGDRAFAGCSNLTSVDFGNCYVKSIGAEAFKNTAKLASLTLPKGLEHIGSDAFSGTNLTDGGSGDYTISNNAVISGNTLLLFTGSGNYTVPAGVTRIGRNAFAYSQIKELTIPASVTEIGEGAFANSTLNKVTILGNISTIPEYAFYKTQLTSVALPTGVTYVGDYAFAETPLSSFSFAPANKAEFGNSVFENCKELAQIALDSNITKMGSKTFAGCVTLQTATLPALESLGAYTFYETPALETVTFNSAAVVTGEYTFAAESAAGRQNLTSITFGSSIKEIGTGLFLNCGALASVNLNGAVTVNDYAFAGCKSLETVTGLSAVTEIGNYAFADCSALKSLTLTSAKTIGDYAFFVDADDAYTEISIPAAVSVGRFAFYGGSETTVNIPASLVIIGDGAFAGSSKLTGFTVADGNEAFFANDGVLYAYVKNYAKQKTEKIENPDNTITLKPLPEYEISVNKDVFTLVAYPSAKIAETVDGEKVYNVLDSTIKVEGSAFRQLNDGCITKVVLPYELEVLGAAAFYQSGITSYEFKGVTAPVLETEHSAIVDDLVDVAGLTSVKGYYYNNFATDFIFYVNMVDASGINLPKLKIYRPENGVGYDNYIFANYFGECTLTGIAKAQATDSFIKFVSGTYSAQEISGWNKDNKTLKEIENYSAQVKAAHENYNAFANDENQMNFVDSSLIEKFNAIETALRPVKALFGINVKISRLTFTGSYKTEYKVGEKFDITGLQIVVIYDDYSSENADMSKVTVIDDQPLTEYDNAVRLSYGGRNLNVPVTVTVNGGNNGDGTVEGGCAGGCGSVDTLGGTALLTLTAVGLMIFVAGTVRRRKQR